MRLGEDSSVHLGEGARGRTINISQSLLLFSPLAHLFLSPVTSCSNMIMTKSSVASMYRPHDSKIADAILAVDDDNFAIATQFAIECAVGNNSKFGPYLKVLPKEVTNLQVRAPPPPPSQFPFRAPLTLAHSQHLLLPDVL